MSLKSTKLPSSQAKSCRDRLWLLVKFQFPISSSASTTKQSTLTSILKLTEDSRTKTKNSSTWMAREKLADNESQLNSISAKNSSRRRLWEQLLHLLQTKWIPQKRKLELRGSPRRRFKIYGLWLNQTKKGMSRHLWIASQTRIVFHSRLLCAHWPTKV